MQSGFPLLLVLVLLALLRLGDDSTWSEFVPQWHHCQGVWGAVDIKLWDFFSA
jgi:hypothetical protein